MTTLTRIAVDAREFIDDVVGRADLDDIIPGLARDAGKIHQIEQYVRRLNTKHRLVRGDARNLAEVSETTVQLVLTSPPYWTLKRYNEHDDQLGHMTDYQEFLDALDEVWSHCFRVLVPGGRLVCVVGDVCLSR